MNDHHPDPAGRMRASHHDRDTVVERLRDAAAEGRLDPDEFDERLERALTAKTHADLNALTADLPAPQAALQQAAEQQRPPLVVQGGISGAALGPNRWQAPAHITAHGGLGGATLDFSRVQSHLPEIHVEAHGDTSGVTIVIPDGWAADTAGIDPGIGGLKDKTTPDRHPGTPLIRLTGTGGLGGVHIRHPNRRERRKLDTDPA
ncbi:DUF1707 SHOCT-like domain-containing protein [Nocardiopsis changdeensis]|nr:MULTISPECIES: DUF1707 domain-containing protein [Nocardiopsis]